MSWRTSGLYKGLTQAEWEWLRAFDRVWDTKAQGRTRKDALDHLKPNAGTAAVKPRSFRLSLRTDEIPDPTPGVSPEIELEALAREVVRFTVPRFTRRGWSIHLTLKSGERVRVRFAEKDQALQAYEALTKAFSIVLAA